MRDRQHTAPLFEAVKDYTKKRPAYFCIPGHRYERGISPLWRNEVGDAIFSYDLTEAHGLDDLHKPEGAIKEAEELAAELYGTKKSYFLVNGSTCGNEAMLLSVLKPGDKVLLPRNVHKSILMGLVLSGARPVWLLPAYVKEAGVYGCVTAEAVSAAFQKDPDIRALCLVSPNYYGMVSDIRGIADECHKRNIPLLVDEAHGGHLYFSERLPAGCLKEGADMCVQSWHKVTGSLTQSSVLHINSDRIDINRVEDALKTVQSTSPSYLLMTSLDLARRELALHGKEDMDALYELAGEARKGLSAIDGIELPGEELIGRYGIHALDISRLLIGVHRLGATGTDFADRLFSGFNVDTELAEENFFLAILTAAGTKEDVEILIKAVAALAKKGDWPDKKKGPDPGEIRLPEQVLSPRQAWFAKKTSLPLARAVGKVAGEAVIPYPPGIPLLYPGERISDHEAALIEKLAGEQRHMHGMADESLLKIRVLADQELF